MKINVRADTDAVVRAMGKIAKTQAPYAISQAINEVAKLCEKEIQKQLKTKVNNPTTFTKNSTFVSYANKRQSPIKATVGVKDKQAEYLIYVEEGGISVAKGKAKPVPTSGSKNKYGNLAKGATKKIPPKGTKTKGPGSIFSGEPRGGRVGGIYKRMGTKKNPRLKQIANWQHSTRHTPRTRFTSRVLMIVARNMEKVLIKKMAAAIATAR